jgi:hypothetical protein
MQIQKSESSCGLQSEPIVRAGYIFGFVSLAFTAGGLQSASQDSQHRPLHLLNTGTARKAHMLSEPNPCLVFAATNDIQQRLQHVYTRQTDSEMRLKQHGPSTLGLRPSKTANTSFNLRQQRPPMIVAILHAEPRLSKTANAPCTVPAAASNRVCHIFNCGHESHPRAPYHADHKSLVGSYHEFGQEEHNKTESSIPHRPNKFLPRIHISPSV